MYISLGLIMQLLVLAQCISQPPITSKKSNKNTPRKAGNATVDPGEPLFLTPYIEKGHIAEGRRQALVPFTQSLNITSYSGFFTVDKKYEANQFFWYFPPMNKTKNVDAVILWLQGGPGATSLYGLFAENGPLEVKNGHFVKREINWAQNYHVIYVDNPVGSGFSFTKDPKGYCANETRVGEHLYSTMIQFFKMFPELQEYMFLITGESYAGKYVPALAYTIHKKNPTAKLKINLTALAIGNGLCDPINQMLYDKYLYQLGLIDRNQATIFQDYQDRIIQHIKEEEWTEAYDVMDGLILRDLVEESIFSNMTGFNFYYNFLHTEDYTSEGFVKLVKEDYVRRDIHVGNLTFAEGNEVERRLKQDVMQSIAPWLTELLDYYYVVFYNGQLDIVLGYPLTDNFINKLNFTGSEDMNKVQRHIWKVGGELAGYVKHVGKIVQVLVRNSGHMVPTDQPAWALDLIDRTVNLCTRSYISSMNNEKQIISFLDN